MLLNLVDLHEKYTMGVRGVLHIGAHYGVENKVYEELQYPHRMFFEPLPSTFEILSNNVKGHTLHNVALGPEPTTTEMFVEVANQGQSSSLLKPKLHLDQYPDITFPHKEEVRVETLDRMVQDKGSYNFINMDVQGYELEVLKGAKETLPNIDYLMCEVNNAELYEGCCLIEDLDEYLGQFGFDRVETDWEGVTWGDAFYVKRNLLRRYYRTESIYFA